MCRWVTWCPIVVRPIQNCLVLVCDVLWHAVCGYCARSWCAEHNCGKQCLGVEQGHNVRSRCEVCRACAINVKLVYIFIECGSKLVWMGVEHGVWMRCTVELCCNLLSGHGVLCAAVCAFVEQNVQCAALVRVWGIYSQSTDMVWGMYSRLTDIVWDCRVKSLSIQSRWVVTVCGTRH